MKSRITIWSTAATLVAALALPIGMAAQDSATVNHHRHHTYTLVELGTLGGPSSYSGNAGFGTHYLNSRGIVTGSADTPTTDPYAPNCYVADCQVTHAIRWQHGTLTDLGALPGVNSSSAGEINERGWIAGQSETGAFDPILNFPAVDPVLWTDRRMIDLGTFGGYQGVATCVNKQGQVAGFATNAIPDQFAEFGAQNRAFLWENGHKRDLGTLGTGVSISIIGNTCLNQRGQVIGGSFTSTIPNPTTGIPTIDPFLWERGRMQDLGGLGGTLGVPQDINSRGQVVGFSDLPGDLNNHPFLWSRGRMIDLGTFGGSNGLASGINDAGDVIGFADFPGDSVHDAFLWRNGRLIDLGNLGATSAALAVNQPGQVVGASRIDSSNVRAFISENGEPLVDLNDLIPPHSSLILVYAFDINEQGVIAGVGAPADCAPDGNETCTRAYVLIPDGDCDRHCEQRIAEHQCDRAAAAQLARAQSASLKASAPISPAERVRNMIRQRSGLSGSHPTLRD